MRIIVAGGAGFIGRHLCLSLLMSGHQVVCVDNLQTSSEENLQEFLAFPDFEFVRHDITKPLPPFIDCGVDRIYNLACAASPPAYQADPIHTMLTNVLGAKHLLDMARETGARFLQASTSEIYGDPQQFPQAEAYRGNVNTTGPRACYDEGKRAAEALISDYGRAGVSTRIARIFNTYGPGMSPYDGRVVTNFLTAAIKGLPIPIYGDGKQTRSFCFVSDTVDALRLLMESRGERLEASPVNIGNPSEITLLQLLSAVREVSGLDCAVTYCPLPVDDPYRRCPDISLAVSELGWFPQVSLPKGLGFTFDALREVLSDGLQEKAGELEGATP